MKKNALVIIFILGCKFIYAQVPNWSWVKSVGSTGAEVGYAICTDAAGNVYAAGYFDSPSIVLGTTTLINAGVWDMFIVKYTRSGDVLWAKSVGNTGSEYPTGISTDAAGNVYVTGCFESTSITFGTITLTNVGGAWADMFIVKYDPFGNALWAKAAGGMDDDTGSGISTDAAGNVYVTGEFGYPSITFGATTLTSAGSHDIFIVKYNASGNVLWAKAEGGIYRDDGLGISTDDAGDVYVTGTFDSPSIMFGSTTLTNAGSFDMFIAKYDASGNVLWAKSAEGTGFEVGSNISADAAGNAYVTGRFESTSITFGATTLTNAGSTNVGGFVNYDMFIVKYDASGNVIWAKAAGGAAHDWGNRVSTDGAGNVYLTGGFDSPTITLGTSTLTKAGGYSDIFIAKYDASGNVLWAKSAEGGEGLGVSPDAAGNVYITGGFWTPSTSFGTITFINAGAIYVPDVFVAKLGSTVTTVVEDGIAVYPNPLSSQAIISFSLSQPGRISLRIYNALGQLIEVLAEGDYQQGTNTITWNVDRVSAGMYLLKMQTESSMVTKKMEVMR